MIINWTEERVDRLRELIGLGYSATQVAADLGSVTRNAVIGKAARLGVFFRGSFSNKAKADRLEKVKRLAETGMTLREIGDQVGVHKTTAGRIMAASGLNKMFNHRIRIVSLPRMMEAPSPMGLTILELTSKSCKWPTGRVEEILSHRFCGAEREDGKVYCSSHCLMAYDSPAQRKADLAQYKLNQAAMKAALTQEHRKNG
jgi:GcrA cell cycle regulator